MCSLDRPSRVVAHFSVDFDTVQKTVLDSDGFVKALESALENRTRSLIEGLRRRQGRQRQSKETTALAKLNSITESDGTCQVQKRSPDVLSACTGEPRKESCLLTDKYLDSRIECVAPGSVVVDLTSVSILSALLAPFPAELNSVYSDVRIKPFERGDKCCTRALDPCCDSDHESACIHESRCPLQALAASKHEWWDRPLWAWTWLEIRMAHGAMIAQNMLEALQLDPACTFCNVSVSTDKCLAQLPFMHRQRVKSCCRETQGGMPILIEPEVDANVICRVVDELCCRSGGGRDQEATTDVCQKLLERYCCNQDSLVKEDYRVEINDLVRSAKMDVIQTSFTSSVSSRTVPVRAGTPEADVETLYAKTINEVQNESPVVKVTPEAERAEVIADTGCDTSDRGLKNPPERQRSPQIDSRGIDVTMLSQLPASIRSEARIAVALRNNISTARGRQKPNARARLQNWFPRISNQCAGKENNNSVIGVAKERKTSWLLTSDVDPDTLRELPDDIQEMIKYELSQGIHASRKRGIDSFFHSTGKRHK